MQYFCTFVIYDTNEYTKILNFDEKIKLLPISINCNATFPELM